MTKQQIYAAVDAAVHRNAVRITALTDRVRLDAYEPEVHDGREIWTAALQAALRAHEIVVIPARETPYFIDGTVVIPSNRRIEAHGAVIRLTPECDVLMLRNEHTADGTHRQLPAGYADTNISIAGGRWEESNTARAGYGRTGKYDAARRFYGVSTLMLFNNLEGLTLTDMTFAHTAGFAVQTGQLKDAHFEHIRFEACYADGLHLNGCSENILARDIRGEVGDDLVALNMYDWQNSSVNFGPTKNVVCEDLELAETGRYKAIRIEPGTYFFDDGTSVDCALVGAVFKNVRGIKTFKLYYQTPRYKLTESPERGDVGSVDALYFEDITIDLDTPIDRFDEYMHADPVRGTFAAFELGAMIGRLHFERIHLTLHEEFPNSCLVCIGPKSVRAGEYEIFDPYLSSRAERLELADIRVNGEPCRDAARLFREIAFDDVNGDGHSTGRGTFGEVYLDGVRIR